MKHYRANANDRLTANNLSKLGEDFNGANGGDADGMMMMMDNNLQIEFDEVNNQVVELGFEDANLADGFAMNINQQFE